MMIPEDWIAMLLITIRMITNKRDQVRAYEKCEGEGRRENLNGKITS